VTPAQSNICQATCLNAATHGGSDPGDMQCNLGVSVRLETAAPCDGTDVTADVGNICFPLTTQEASAGIIDANFTAGAVVPSGIPPFLPPPVNDLPGTPLTCPTLSATTSGLVAVSAVNFLGAPSVGDISANLKLICQ
jgi:hypothetical protein